MVRHGSEAVVGATLGAATWVGGLPILRAYGAAVIPEASTARLVEAVPIALAATVAFVALCYELSRLLTPRSDGTLVYAVAFTSVHLVFDAAFLFAAFRHGSWAPRLSTEQLHGLAAFLPLAYLAMLWVPLVCQWAHGRPNQG